MVSTSMWPTFQFTLPARGATRFHPRLVAQPAFQFTLPARGATLYTPSVRGWCASFQFTLPARGATPHERAPFAHRTISIHAPRTGSDLVRLGVMDALQISIHAPRTGSDGSVRRHFDVPADFNSRSPHGERHRPAFEICGAAHFNSRSPHGERRCPPSGRAPVLIYFNSRSPHGERQRPRRDVHHHQGISIHAPRTGSDAIMCDLQPLSLIHI